ncbi:hypothetical protein ACFV30_41805 [Streptomyces sp. NPDC059752]|uniref:hypothetical protein n=1 Tax=unclassified Streptomyces TaxID=2593676 RepID=UPI0036627BC9
MDSALRLQARPGQRALLITTLAIPLTGCTVHALALHRRLADARKDLLSGLPCRPEFTAYGERRLRTRHRAAGVDRQISTLKSMVARGESEQGLRAAWRTLKAELALFRDRHHGGATPLA